MQLPGLNVIKENMTMINAFRGYNHNLRIGEDEFYEMENMTNDYYPVLANRKKRGIIDTLESPTAMAGFKKLVYVDANKLFYDRNYVCDLPLIDVERHLVMMGAYICVFPDGILYNTYDGKISNVENRVDTADAPTFTLCKLDGTKYDDTNTVTGNTEPEDKSKYWIDTSTDPVVMKMYNSNTSMWVSVATTYVKIEATGIGVGFKQYDAVEISGVDKNENIYNGIDFNTTNILYDVGDDYLVVVGFINKTFVNSQILTIERKMPDMDYVIERNNRIWGCSSEKHEVYACKQGDPTNWYCYMGLDSDSYAATVGTDGDFTAIANYQGALMFFKENGYHRLYGSKPSSYQLEWKPGIGVREGCAKSVATVNGTLYFCSEEGICAYDGSFSKMKQIFGQQNFYDAVGGAYRDKYYVSMRNEDYEYAIYVYDSIKQTWVKEDKTVVKAFAYSNKCLYVLTSDNQLLAVSTETIYTAWFPNQEELGEEYLYPGDIYPGDIVNGDEESKFEWSVTTGELGLDSPFQKYIKKLILRCWISENAKIKLEIMYDSSDDWEVLKEYYATRKRSMEIPFQVRRCDHFQLRISGFGDIRIYSIAKVIEEGSTT